MEFVRKIINSNELESLFELPEELRHRNVEVLILPISQEQEKKRKGFNPNDFKGITNIENVEEDIRFIRDEWERI